MSRRSALGLGVVACLVGGVAWTGAVRNAAAAAPVPSDRILERGRYIVEHVGMCVDCHSPRNERGEFVKEEWLQGAPLKFKPVVEMPWAELAIPIAGLPTMTSDQGVHFLMTGEKPDGTHPRPPMPEYRLDREDAEAAVAYLKSLASTR